MADSKLSGLTATTVMGATDLLYTAVGASTSRKITFANFEAALTVANMVGGAASGTGNIVRVTGATLVTPDLGTPSAVVLTNATGTASSLIAGKAVILNTARTINGTSFDGSGNITVTAAAGTLTGTVLNATVVTSSLTAVGTIITGVWNGTIITSGFGGTGNGFTKFTGATTSEKTYTLPDSSVTILYSGGALGTPSSGTLTNATGLPVAGIVSSTSTALGVGSLELGHASDTTISRSAAGVIAVEGVVIPSISSTNTLTNKRVTRRLVSVNAPGATPTTNTDNVDIAQFTGLNTAITSMTTNLSGTPVDGDLLQFQFLDDGTGRGITWGATFANGGLVNLPTTTIASTVLRVLVQYQTAASLNKWVCIATA